MVTGHVDDLGTRHVLDDRVERVVSLVPSLTEAIAESRPGLLVGATDWCTHPADLDVVRVRGTKNPDLDTIRDLAPDLVVVNVEENRARDAEALRADGIPVWATDVRTVDRALDSLERLSAVLAATDTSWLADARQAWAAPDPVTPDGRVRAVVAVWRRPWMFLGSDTYAGDVLARLGVDNVLADSADRYPAPDIDDLPGHDLVVLPDEPYEFTADDGPEAFATPTVLVDGRDLTWYGPAMVDAPRQLRAALRTGFALGRGS